MGTGQQEPTELALSIKKGQYRHFKGHPVTLIGVAKHTETLDEFAVYDHDGKLWVRPLKMFVEYVEKPEYGYAGPRFAYVGGQ